MISKNVMKTDEFDNSIFYRVSCGCSSDDHDIGIEFEMSGTMIFLNFAKRVSWCDNWGITNIFGRVWKRLTCSIAMLFMGYVDLEETFIVDKDNINGFIEALQEGERKINAKIKAQKRSFEEKAG